MIRVLLLTLLLCLTACQKAPDEAAGAKAGEAGAVNLADAGPRGDATKGKAVYEKICQACHQADGSGMNGMLAADLAKDKTRLAQPDSVLLDHISNGFKGEKLEMPPQKGVISEAEIKDALAYVRSKFGG